MKNLRIFYRPFLLFYITTFLFTSCSDDDSTPSPIIEGEYSSGVFIINEGNFGSDNSSISFYDRATEQVSQNIFNEQNDRKLGNTAQSMFIKDSLAYIIVNASNKLEVVNYATFKSKGGINEGLVNPRYFTIYKSKGYITNWGSFDGVTPAFIAVVDLNTLAIEDKINTGNGPETIMAIGDKLFFTNNFGNTLGVLDPVSKEITEITLASSPSAMVEDENGKLWVICGGDYGQNNGKLFRVNPKTNAIEATIDLETSGSKMVIDEDGDEIFYISGSDIYQLDIDATTAPSTPWATNETASFYGLGYDPVADVIYAGDANAFQSAGTVYRYDEEGELLGSFDAGVGPSSFVFK